ncbi:MAG: hypothetical protein J6Q54_07080 [Oscillospiraceae bacterium]|nr:hypothetical protein [Oscillospiraceae bacterium]
MTLRRILSLLVALCLIAGIMVQAVAAAEEVSLEEIILQGCTYLQETDISQFDLNHEEFDIIFDKMRHSGRVPWFVSGSYSYTYDKNTGKMLSFTPEAVLEGNIDMFAYEEGIAEILNACVLPGMTQEQIALSLHDYLVANTAYDSTKEKNTAYDLVVNGTTVCAGYAEAYQDLLLRCGIECLYIVSDEMNHAWNQVKIDGVWYHADLTWDDPSPDAYGRVQHDYLLVTDEEIAAGEHPHYGWKSDIVCTDTRFSDSWWRDSKAQVCYVNSTFCYYQLTVDWANHIYYRNEDTGIQKLFYQAQKKSVDVGSGKYFYGHQGLSLRNGRLYFNTLEAVMSIDVETRQLQLEYAHGGNTYVSGCHVADDTLYATFMTHDSEPRHMTQPLEPVNTHIHEYTHTVTAPTCTEGGITYSQCQCGIAFAHTPVAPVAHNFRDSLSTDGITHTCADCGYRTAEPVIPEGYELSAVLMGTGILLLIVALFMGIKWKG